MIIKPEELKIVYEKEDDGRIRPVYSIDAVEVVRCRECKWWKSSWKYCRYIHFDTDKEFYCAAGERRPDERSD